MGFSETVSRLDVTRARIEASITEAAVIVVTSALPGDGKRLLATALTYSFAAVGHRVLLVGADQHGPPIEGLRPAPRLSDRPDYDVLSFAKHGVNGVPDLLDLSAPGIAGSCSRETTEATFARFRAAYPVTIVYTSTLSSSGVAFSFASLADHVVLAFRQGRAAKTADRVLSELLASAHASVSGVVLLDPKSIRSFEQEHRSSFKTTRLSLSTHSDEAAGKSASLGVRAG